MLSDLGLRVLDFRSLMTRWTKNPTSRFSFPYFPKVKCLICRQSGKYFACSIKLYYITSRTGEVFRSLSHVHNKIVIEYNVYNLILCLEITGAWCNEYVRRFIRKNYEPELISLAGFIIVTFLFPPSIERTIWTQKLRHTILLVQCFLPI